MSYKKDIIYLIIIAILGAVVIKFIFIDNPSYYEDYNSKIEALNLKIDSLHSENDKLITSLDSLNNEISELDAILISSKNTINRIKNETDKALDAAYNFSKSELDKFFSDRYRFLLSDTTRDSSEGDY